jgi:hypothetical protein
MPRQAVIADTLHSIDARRAAPRGLLRPKLDSACLDRDVAHCRGTRQARAAGRGRLSGFHTEPSATADIEGVLIPWCTGRSTTGRRTAAA